MAISSTRKVSLSSPGRVMASSNRSQMVEDIDTNNNVLVKDDNQNDFSDRQFDSRKNPEVLTYGANVSTSVEALTLSGVLEEDSADNSSLNNKKVNVYSSNQSIVKDEDVERIGRSYLKKFYEENEPITDVNELV